MTIFAHDKILKHLDRVSLWSAGKNPPPICVEIDMTNLCNHACPDCTGWHGNASNSMLSKKINVIKLITDLKKWGVKSLVFSGGGEPLVARGTIPAIIHAKKQGLDVGLITNGGLLTSDHYSCCGNIIENCVWVRVSLDAADAQMHAITHGTVPGSREFGTIISGLMMLVAKKKQYKSACTIGVGYMVNDETMGSMFNATRLCKQIGVDYIEFRLPHGEKRCPAPNILNACESESTNEFKVLNYKYDAVSMELKCFYDKCYGQAFATIIAADAKMYVCCHTRGNPKYCIGDLTKNSVIDIWHSSRRQKVVNRINPCKDCIPYCRCHSFNLVLWRIKQPQEHMNFL